MTFQGDPHRTLGVTPGASLNEIKSAYRRLVKQYHPDAAGERALPRFLSIQAAYERLVDGEGRLRPQGTRPEAPRPAEPWRADPSRARASRDAWRARRSGGGGARTASSGSAGTADASDPDASSSGPDPSSSGSSGAGPRRERPHREHHARRGPRKATPGSTTYDEAAELPLDPEWDGGAWYGPSSGTFWTINPREYADPRKHGPEYLARARRAVGLDREEDDAPAADASATFGGEAAPGATAGPAGRGPSAEGGDGDRAAPRWRWTGDESTTTDGGVEWGTRAWRYDDVGDPPVPGERRRGWDGATPRPAGAPDEPLPDLESIARRFAPRPLLALARRPDRRWRLALALTGWPPIGYAVGTLAAELTGCAGFAACPEPLPMLPLLLQPLVVGGLFLVPPAAAVAGFAGVVALAVALPVAAVLSVGSLPSSRVGAGMLGVIVAVAYLVALIVGAKAAWRAPRGAGEPPEGS